MKPFDKRENQEAIFIALMTALLVLLVEMVKRAVEALTSSAGFNKLWAESLGYLAATTLLLLYFSSLYQKLKGR